MMRLADIPKRAVQRAQGVAQQPGEARRESVEPAVACAAADRLGQAENVCRRDPVTAFQGRIRRHEAPARGGIIPDETMDCQSSAISVQYDASSRESVGWRGFDAEDFAVADDRIHARAEGLKGYGGVLAQQGFDDFLGSGHGRDRVQMQKV